MNLKPSAPAKPAAPPRSTLAVGVLTSRVHREITIPRTSVRGAMRLLSRSEVASVRAACRDALSALATGPALEGFREWHEELAVRTLAVAVRDPDDNAEPLASLSDWQECDDEQIGAVWEWYQDLEAELDPLGADGGLTSADVDVMLAAAKKKGGALLMSFGSRKLAAFAITLAEQLSSSPTPK